MYIGVEDMVLDWFKSYLEKITSKRRAAVECFGTSFIFHLHDRTFMDFETTKRKD